MTHHKSATFVGTLSFAHNSNRTKIWLGHNHNTGEAIVWQSVNGGRETRITGKNLVNFAQQLNEALNEGEVSFGASYSGTALDFFKTLL